MKNPAVIASSTGSAPAILGPTMKVKMAPRSAVQAERTLSQRTFFLEYPALRRMAKSPISCGISCAPTARVVITPSAGSTKKVTAMATPSMKLWIESPRTMSVPTGFFASSVCSW